MLGVDIASNLVGKADNEEHCTIEMNSGSGIARPDMDIHRFGDGDRNECRAEQTSNVS